MPVLLLKVEHMAGEMQRLHEPARGAQGLCVEGETAMRMRARVGIGRFLGRGVKSVWLLLR